MGGRARGEKGRGEGERPFFGASAPRRGAPGAYLRPCPRTLGGKGVSALSFSEFLAQLSDPGLRLVVLLTLGVILVNGWTDAPNAIATAVSSGALSYRAAVALAAGCNLLGAAVTAAFRPAVAQSIYGLADFGPQPRAALCALCAALLSIVLWSAAAWVFGIPTSESHALVAALTGAAAALGGGLSSVNWGVWAGVLWGLFLSVGLGFLLGQGLGGVKARRRGRAFYRRAQTAAAAAMAFLHGAQDGQKFLGVFLLGTALAQGRQESGALAVPLWLLVLCALTMALGTCLGGRRIIDRVGRDMVSLDPRQGCRADVAGGACLLLCTLLGLPVSTTHAKTAAMLGVGSAGGRAGWATARSIALTWALTFPGCALLGFFSAKVLLFFL